MAAARNVVHPGNLMHYAAHLERWRDAGDLPGTVVSRIGGEGGRECSFLGGGERPAHGGLGADGVEAVERSIDHVEVAGHARRPQTIDVGEILVEEQVEGADADPGRRQPAEVLLAGGCRTGGTSGPPGAAPRYDSHPKRFERLSHSRILVWSMSARRVVRSSSIGYDSTCTTGATSPRSRASRARPAASPPPALPPPMPMRSGSTSGRAASQVNASWQSSSGVGYGCSGASR